VEALLVFAKRRSWLEFSYYVIDFEYPDTILYVKVTRQDYARPGLKTEGTVKVVEKRSELPYLTFGEQ